MLLLLTLKLQDGPSSGEGFVLTGLSLFAIFTEVINGGGNSFRRQKVLKVEAIGFHNQLLRVSPGP